MFLPFGNMYMYHVYFSIYKIYVIKSPRMGKEKELNTNSKLKHTDLKVFQINCMATEQKKDPAAALI